MKKLASLIVIFFLLSSTSIVSQNMQKEIEDSIDAMIKCSMEKDINNLSSK